MAAKKRTNEELAATYRQKLLTDLNSVASIMQLAAGDGFEVNFNIGRDSNGTFVVQALTMTKNF